MTDPSVAAPAQVPMEYVLKEVEREICDDARLGELNVHLTVRGERIYVRGDVSSAAGRQAPCALRADEGAACRRWPRRTLDCPPR